MQIENVYNFPLERREWRAMTRNTQPKGEKEKCENTEL